jgi:RecA/RadA recombinase
MEIGDFQRHEFYKHFIFVDFKLMFRVSIENNFLNKETDEEIMRDMFQFHEALKDMISLRADDCGLVILDSVAALFPSDMMDSSLDDKVIGNQAKLVTNLINKVNSRLSKEYKRGHPCLVLLTNQLRANIGVFYGPSTTQPGGYAIRFFSALTIHISKKALQDKEKYYDKEKDLHMAQKHSFILKNLNP